MADADPDLVARIARGIAALDRAEWDGLAAAADPFVGHAFLALLEESGSVGGDSGWSPLPLIVDRSGAPIAAAPAYLKTHSQGEYIFDHGWADAWERAGGSYYPKLLVAVPFTPVPGPRLLGDRAAALAAIEALTVQNGLSSAHVNFCEEPDVAAAEPRGWLRREGLQYHWFNRDYSCFDDFLDTLSSRKRKAIRKERAEANAGLDIVALRGADIEPVHWDAMWHFYQDTGSRKWGRPYLTRAFFDLVGRRMGDSALLFLALDDGRPIAGALNFVGGSALYGRYWGAIDERRFLHFELSYYQAIEWAIAHGLTTVQAGAQGEHKLARGYEPVVTRSLHFLPDRGFRAAVAQFLEREREGMRIEADHARAALPFRAA